MITLNPFVENNKARINQFLNNLCEVGDFYDTLEVSELIRLFPLFLLFFPDGSIYGSLQKRSHDSHHVK